MEMDNPDAQMFGDLPSRLASRSAMSFHHRAASRRSLRGKLSNAGESAVALPVDRVESQLEMLDLEDSTNDPLAESRNLDKIKAAPISLVQKKSIK